MTQEQTIDYIRCMTITQNVDQRVYKAITSEHIRKVMDYIDNPMTATTITELPGAKKKGRKQLITSEVIYYYMTAYNIPFDPCQKWHLNRLMMLIRVCDEKNQKPKKMSRREAAIRNHNLNAARRAQMRSRG